MQSKTKTKKAWILCAIIFLLSTLINSCHSYNPAFFHGYDVLNPDPIVRMNPLDTTADGHFIVNREFLEWVQELQLEIKRLRERLDK
jgi:hypothetical protein